MQTEHLARDTASVAENLYFGLAVIVILYGLGLSSATLLQSYSYWLDELFSVTASNQNLHSMFGLILSDVHPPLYQLLLKLWIGLFGDGEVATRSLSYCAALVAIYPVYKTCAPLGRSCAITAVLFLCTSTLFGFYGNETRAYALLMTCSAITYRTFFDLEEESLPLTFLLNCFVLSLVHYFGLLFSWVLLLLAAWTLRRNKVSLIAIGLTFAITCVWPVVHIVFGTVSSKAGGNFWIQVNGVLETLSVAAFSLFAIPGILPGIFLVGGLIIIIGATSAVPRLRTSYDPAIFGARRSAIAILAFLALLCAVDHFTPMSTRRNYIVLLPPSCILVAQTIYAIRSWRPELALPMLTLALISCVVSTGNIASALREKSRPIEDWKGAAQFVLDHQANMNVYYVTNNYDNRWRTLTSTFYLNKLGGRPSGARPFVPGETRISAPALIFVAHYPFVEPFLKSMKEIGAIRSFPATPFDQNSGSVFRVDASPPLQ